MKLIMMKEHQAYSIILPFVIMGLTMLSIDAFGHRLTEITIVGYVGALLAISGTFIFFYHLYTILSDMERKDRET